MNLIDIGRNQYDIAAKLCQYLNVVEKNLIL